MKLNWPLLTCWLFGVVFQSCSMNEMGNIEMVVDQYYQVYNERQDFEKFIDFYDESIVLEDIVNGDRIVGKQAMRNFFDWSNSSYQNSNSNILTISEKIIDKNKSVVKGVFTNFKWGDLEVEAMHFTSILTFNESADIVKQIDWINYPSTLVNYNDRKNSNEWVQ